MNANSKKFVDFSARKTRKQKIEIKNSWFRHCELNSLPYLEVEHTGKYSNVHFDFINLNETDENLFSNENNDLKNELYKIFDSYSNSQSTFSGSGGVFYLDKLDTINATKAAIEIFDHISMKLINQPN